MHNIELVIIKFFCNSEVGLLGMFLKKKKKKLTMK